MARNFGIELEIAGVTQSTVLSALRSVGVAVQSEGYNHTTRNHWKLVSDSSVRGGFEVVSPILSGEAGIEEARTVVTALDDAGAKVNVTCGFHLHIDAAGLSVHDVRNIVTRYAKYESEIDAIMPPSRRGDANEFCHSVCGLVTRRPFNTADTVNGLMVAQGGRYFKVNLQSFQRHGTIEFRQHSGTVNAAKVCNWIRFIGQFIEASRQPTPVASAPVIENPNLRGVQAKLAAMFTAQGTVRLAAMCEQFGWQPHTARAAVTRLRRAGLEIAPVKVDGEAAYKLTSGMVRAAQAAPQADSLWRGIEEGVCRFYRNRAAVLAAV